MSSGGQILGGIGGAIVGGFLGGPTGALYGAQIGITAGGIIDPPKGPNQAGPRLDDLSMQGASYGSAIPRVYGTAATAGTVVWLENNEYKEVAKKTTQGGKGGPTSTTTTYSYYATFALVISRGPIIGVRRIWGAGATLIYDAGSDDIDTIIASNNVAAGFRLHLGTADQEPDERMQATLGTDCPAHRGIAYLVFDDFPLADYNNNLAATQFKVEIVSLGEVSPFARVMLNDDTGIFYHENSTYTYYPQPYIERVDEGVVVVGTTGSVAGNSTRRVFSTAGEILYEESAATPMDEWYIGKTHTEVVPCGVLGGQHLYARSVTSVSAGSVLRYASGVAIDHNLPASEYLVGVTIANDGLSVIAFTSATPTGMSVQNWFWLDEGGNVLRSGVVGFAWGNNLWGYSRCAHFNFLAGSFDQDNLRIATANGAGNAHVFIYTIDDDDVIRLEHTGTLNYVQFSHLSVYLQGQSVFVVTGNNMEIFSLGSISSDTVPLADIIDAECALSSILQPGDYDTSDLADEVRGYRVGSIGALRAAIEPLQGAFPFDVVQSGYVIKFKRRGSASVLSFSADELDARAFGAAAGVSQVIAREMDTQLPAKVTVKHLDADREYDTGSQYAERLGTQSGNETTIDLPLVLTADEAAQAAQVLISMYWLERTALGPYHLPPTARAIEPGDVVTIDGRDVRVRDITLESDGRVTVAGKDAAPFSRVYSSSAVGATGSVTGQALQVAGPSYAVLIDGPTMTTDMNRGGFVGAVCGLTSGWPSGALMNSSDGGQTWRTAQGFADEVPIGQALSALPAPADSRAIDTISTVSVRMVGGALTSTTLAALFGGANLFAVGAHGRWEIVAAQNCTLQGDGTYLLDTMLRGLFGTEHAMTSHAVGDAVVLVSDEDAAFIARDNSAIGTSDLWRAVTTGKSVDVAQNIAFTYSAENLKPLAPAYLRANRSTAGDWSVAWMRRERVDAWWRNTGTVGMSEASEAYAVKIYASPAATSPIRTIDTTSEAATYSYAEQVQDGTSLAQVTIGVSQVSAVVGAGREARSDVVPAVPYVIGPPGDEGPFAYTYQFRPIIFANGRFLLFASGRMTADGTFSHKIFYSTNAAAWSLLGAVAVGDVSLVPGETKQAALTSGTIVQASGSTYQWPESTSVIKGSPTAISATASHFDAEFGGHRPAAIGAYGSTFVVLCESNLVYSSGTGAAGSWTYRGEMSGTLPAVMASSRYTSTYDGLQMARTGSAWMLAWGGKILQSSDYYGVSGWTQRADMYSLLSGAVTVPAWRIAGFLKDGTTWYARVTNTGAEKYTCIIRSTNDGVTWSVDKVFGAGESDYGTRLVGPWVIAGRVYLYESEYSGAGSYLGWERTTGGTWSSFVTTLAKPQGANFYGANGKILACDLGIYGPRYHVTSDGTTFAACTGLTY